MNLYLVRHGDYALDTKGLDVLTEKGKKDIMQLANHLKQMNVQVERILHSGKNRAQQTAELLAQAVPSREAAIALPGLNPNDEVIGIAGEIIHWKKDIMLVGHLPFMGRLATYLLTGQDFPEIVNFQTGTIACLSKACEAQWMIDWVIRPRNIGWCKT